MLRVTLRGLAARKLRTILTASAVVLGVAMIAGTYVLTDTINRSFNGIFKQATKGVDVSVTPREVVSQDKVSAGDFPEALLAKARGVDGVRKAAGGIFTDGTIYKKNGKRSGLGGAPNIITTPRPAPFDPFSYTQGRPPQTPDEVALDRFTAQKGGYHLGDMVRIAGSEPAKRYRLVGLAKFGDVESLGGASLAILQLREAQRATGEVGKLQVLDLQASPGVTPLQLRNRVRAAMPHNVTVRTGKQEASAQASDTKQGFSFITTFLLVFAGVALFVGAFMIFNTFSITVAQRQREFAMLRTLGASRRQILRAVVGEAALVGLAASLVGLLCGLALAPGLRALFKTLGAELPSSGTVIASRTVIVSLLVGHAGHPGGQPAAGRPRHPRRAHGRPLRGRRAPEPSRRALAHGARGGAVAGRRGTHDLRALRPAQRRLGRGPAGPGRRGGVRGRGAAERPAGQAAHAGGGRAPARDHRPAGPREHHAQPRAAPPPRPRR